MTGGNTFSHNAVKDPTRDAVFVTLQGQMHLPHANEFFEQVDLLVAERMIRYVFLLGNLEAINAAGAGRLITLSGEMSRARGVVILDEPPTFFADRVRHLSGQSLHALFKVTHGNADIQRELDEHARTKLGTVSLPVDEEK